MKTCLQSLAFVLLCLCGHNAWAGSKVCTFSNVGGSVKSFFSTTTGVSAFPCSYKMANFRCGKAKAIVTAENAIDDDGQLYIRSVTVDTIITPYGKTIRQVNTLSVKDIDRFVGKKMFDKRLWKWTLEGTNPEKVDRIMGYYDRARKAAYVTYGDLTVDWVVKTDTLTINCSADAFKTAVKFPKTICGSPDNTVASVLSLDKVLPHNKTLDMTLTRLDYVQLAKQDAIQIRPNCIEASDLVSGKCRYKGNTLYMCHMLYSPFEKGTYSRCMKRNGIDAFKVYTACVRILCSKQRVIPLFMECKELNEVSEKCGDIKASPVKVSELLARSLCGLPKKYQPAKTPPTTKKPTTKAPPAAVGGGW